MIDGTIDWLSANLADYRLLLLCCGGFSIALMLAGRHNAPLRAFAAGLCMLLGLRYVWWRLTQGIPASQGPLADLWVAVFLVFEMLGILGVFINLLMLSRTSNRSAEVNQHADHPICAAPVDVLIATYNEGPDILERTLIAAAAIEHPDKRVWLLDDGARDWARALAETHGAHYAFRIKGRHAKAGNVNHGLALAMATGRPPAFILLLDADFVAARDILRRTMPLFHADDVGIVQTPQFFFNPDPIQTNVFSPTVWPDEQRFFFNVLLPSLDAWGGAICCGTSAVLRVEALAAIGGMATETVTEDMLTSFKMIEHGFRTVYLDEPLSLGLAPEGVSEYIVQRSRWCLGAIQQIYTRWSFAGAGRLRWIDRLNNFSAVLYWSAAFPFRLLMMAVPAVWWWTGASAVNATTADLTREVLPFFVTGCIFNVVYSGSRLLPLLSDINQLVPSIAVIASVMTGLLRPWGQPFRVTPKGLSSQSCTVHWSLMAPFLLLAAVTLAGMTTHIGMSSTLRAESGFALSVVWSLVDIAMLAVTCLACVDQPRRRRDERFATHERAVVLLPGQPHIVCAVEDISLGGCLLQAGSDRSLPSMAGTLWLDDGRLQLPFETVRAFGNRLAVRFVLTPPLRAALILKLFNFNYAGGVEKVHAMEAIQVALRRLMA